MSWDILSTYEVRILGGIAQKNVCSKTKSNVSSITKKSCSIKCVFGK